jgi:hypothetical protein
MIFVGYDWAEDHHDVYVMDADGARLVSRRLPEGLAGIRALHESSAPGCSVSSGTTRTGTPPPSLAKTTPGHHR